MLSTKEALDQLLTLVTPLKGELVDIDKANGRVLFQDHTAKISQPSFASSAMDGYALHTDKQSRQSNFVVVGESAAGHPFTKKINKGEAVRIFTGAVVPEGANIVIMQEDVITSNNQIKINKNCDLSGYIRQEGSDFKKGFSFKAPKLLTPYDIMLLAGMGFGKVKVTKKPTISVISTGDELVVPGTKLKKGQIICSNSYGIKAILEENGAIVNILPIAKDTIKSLETAIRLSEDSDLVITTGGASVGDHDLVGQVIKKMGIKTCFYKVAMRPGKPLMAGRSKRFIFVGLPGNPVSSMVCSHVFLNPMINKMLGLSDQKSRKFQAKLEHPLEKNGARQHYMRALVNNGKVMVQKNQDSASTSILQNSNALVIRPPNHKALDINDLVDVILL